MNNLTHQPYNYLKKFQRLPVILILLISVICCYGFVVLYSAGNGNLKPWAYKQMLNFLLFMPLSIIIACIDLRIIYRSSYSFYFAIFVLLLGIEAFGHVAMGAKRWIDLGFIRLQPSEPAKLAIVLMLARYFHHHNYHDLQKIRQILIPACGVIVPAALIIKQPDLGTGIITLIVAVTMFFAAGLAIWKFVASGVAFLASLPIIWHFLHDYQKKRVLVFLDPEHDPLGASYNIIQSKIAIGSGGVVGKGLTQGTQSHLSFLPEHQTDFIFACLAEELGFVGGLVLLVLYFLVIYLSLVIAINCRSMFGKFMTIGVTTIFFSHVFINMAMVMGMLPAVGVPLPFISYGGTMMASMLIGFGLVMNANVHQHINIGNN